MTKTAICQVLDATNNTVTNVCRSFQTQRLEVVEHKKPTREYKHSLDGQAEAYLIAIACSAPNRAGALDPTQQAQYYSDAVSVYDTLYYGAPYGNES